MTWRRLAVIKRSEYSLLGKEMKNQNSVAERYQKFESSKNEKEKTKSKRNPGKSNIVYNKDFKTK